MNPGLRNLPIEDRKEFTIPVLPVKQPIGEFFLGVIDSKRVCEITEFDVRQLLKERDLDTYLGIQRRINPKRIKDIEQYVRTVDATFPTSIILSVTGDCATYNSRERTLTLSNYQDPEAPERTVLYKEIAKVIDGQHRIEGLKDYTGTPFELSVCIFVDLDVAEEGYIFSTVNLAQTKVNKSLVYDLFDLAKSKSPQKLSHNIAVALDQNKDSPFFERIKRLGTATEGRFNETLTQATFVEAMLRYLSDNPIQDRDLYIRGKVPTKVGSADSRRLIFRNMMIEGKDLEIADVIWNYFNAVRARWPEAWANMGRGSILNKTNGFRALMRFLRPAYLDLGRPGQVPTTEQFRGIFGRMRLQDDEFTTANFVPGTSGEVALFNRFKFESGVN
jgi:DGQHR domain-containing protein